MGGAYSMHGRDEKCIHRWEDNIRMYLTEIGWEGVNWSHLAQDRDQWWALLNKVMNLCIP
jgi:hypothetical protein